MLSAIQKVAKIRADFDDFDGDRRGIGDCLDEAEQEPIVTINKYASQLAAEPIAPNDVREQTAIPQVPVTPDGWIPVSERMPEPYEYVLVTDGFDGCEVMRVNTDGYWGPAKSLYPGSITHWMPLPAAPQQEVNRG